MRRLSAFLAIAALLSACSNAHAQSERFEIGVRTGVSAADGEPGNDIPGYGIWPSAR